MAESYEIIIGAVSYNLNDLVDFKVVEEDGFGLPPSHLITERGPLQHGETVVDFRLDPRYILLSFFGLAQSEANHQAERDTLLAALKLTISPVLFRRTRNDGEIRQIDCFYDGGLSFPSTDRHRYLQKNGVSLYCPDPLFYDPAVQQIVFQPGGSDTFPVPMSVPHTVGASTMDSNQSIDYEGTERTYPHLIRITGPITNPIITNLNLGSRKLSFQGTTIAGGAYYDIDLRFGYKTVIDNTGANKIDKLTDDSDLVDWYIAADPEIPGGLNTIQATGSAITVSTKIDLFFFNRFIGM